MKLASSWKHSTVRAVLVVLPYLPTHLIYGGVLQEGGQVCVDALGRADLDRTLQHSTAAQKEDEEEAVSRKDEHSHT